MKTTRTFERFYCDTVRDLWVLYECLKTVALRESDIGSEEDLEAIRREVLDNVAQALADLNGLSYNLDIAEEDNRPATIDELQLLRSNFATTTTDMNTDNISDSLRWADEHGIVSLGDVPVHEQEMQDMEMQDPNTNDQQEK